MTHTPLPDDDEQKKIDDLQQRFEAARNPQMSGAANSYVNLVPRLQARLARLLGPDDRSKFETEFEALLAEESVILSRPERRRLFEQLRAELFGLGPLEAILADPEVTEVMINGFNSVFIDKGGQLQELPSTFRDNDHLLTIIQRIAEPNGRILNESHPLVDMRLADGSRVNAVIPPIALNGPCLTIRKFTRTPLGPDDLLQRGTLDSRVLEFLRACVAGRANMIVVGGTGDGKTTLLNALASFIPNRERIITVESAAELALKQRHVVTLEARPPNLEGRGAITLRDLVANALRMRPDRVLLGEARGPEVLEFLQALNTGHDGSITTLHAFNARDALTRLENLMAAENPALPLRACREQIASALQLIVHISRLKGGARQVLSVTEIQGLEGDEIALAHIFVFEPGGREGGRATGRLAATGKIPRILHQLREAGLTLPMDLFAPN